MTSARGQSWTRGAAANLRRAACAEASLDKTSRSDDKPISS